MSIQLQGNWKNGYALALHTDSSIPIKDSQGKIVGWDTKRPPIGEAVYQFKYCNDISYAPSLAGVCDRFITAATSKTNIDVIIPMLPSKKDRPYQPVQEIMKELVKISKIPIDFYSLKKVKDTTEIKSITDPSERQKQLEDAFDVEENKFLDKNILLFDDVFKTGATLNAVCNLMLNKGKAKAVYVLTLTKTRT